MKRSFFSTSTGLGLLLSVGLILNACNKEEVAPVNDLPPAAPMEGAQRMSPASFLTWTALGTEFTVWRNGRRMGKISFMTNPFGVQIVSNGATSMTVEGVQYQPCTTTSIGLLTFQKGATPGSWGPYYDLTSPGLQRLRFRIKNGVTPVGSDAGGYFNMNNGTNTWSVHGTTNTYFQWATGVIFDNYCINPN